MSRNELEKEALMAKLEKALTTRKEGNNQLAAGDLQEAMRSYYNALLQLKGLGSSVQSMFGSSSPAPQKSNADTTETPPVEVQVSQAIGLCYLNMAAIHLKKANYRRALECSLEALKSDPSNNKGKFREAQARIGLGQINKGRTMLQDLQKESPDAAIASALAQLDIEEKKRLAVQKSTFSACMDIIEVFSRSADRNMEQKVCLIDRQWNKREPSRNAMA